MNMMFPAAAALSYAVGPREGSSRQGRPERSYARAKLELKNGYLERFENALF